MIVVAFDTNVLVSAMYTPHGNESRAIELWHAGRLKLAVSDAMLAEYETVLTRPKFRFDPDKVRRFLAPFQAHRPRIVPPQTLSVCPHEPDNRFLECAEAAQADFLITGNLRHFPQSYGPTRILNAKTFLDLIQP
jgi:putative PIN family toxin of toxin-antitoxin system